MRLMKSLFNKSAGIIASLKGKRPASTVKRKNPGVRIGHIDAELPNGEKVHRIVAGEQVPFMPAENKHMAEGGIGGSHGTLEFKIMGQSGNAVGHVYFEVPESSRRQGIGTNLLLEAEAVASKLNVNYLEVNTFNQRAVRACENAGWKII